MLGMLGVGSAHHALGMLRGDGAHHVPGMGPSFNSILPRPIIPPLKHWGHMCFAIQTSAC